METSINNPSSTNYFLFKFLRSDLLVNPYYIYLSKFTLTISTLLVLQLCLSDFWYWLIFQTSHPPPMIHFPLYDDHTSGPTSRPITLLYRLLTPFQLCFLPDDPNSIVKPSCKSTHKGFSMESVFTSPFKTTKPAYATLPGKKLLFRFLRHQCQNPCISKANSKTNHRGEDGCSQEKVKIQYIQIMIKRCTQNSPHKYSE